MANDFSAIVPQLLAQGLITLRENAVMPRLVNTDYDSIAAQKGSAITVPVPAAVAVQDVTPGAYSNATADTTPSAVTISLNQWKEAPFYLTDKDLLEVQNGVIPMQAAEAIKALGNYVDNAILAVFTGVYGSAGTAGTTPFTTDTTEATAARKVLNAQLAPLTDRRFVMNPDAEEKALNLRAFQDFSWSGDANAIKEGKINRKLGFDWYMNQNVPDFTTGTRAGSTLVAQADHAIGDTVVTVDGGTATTTAAVGDIFTVAGDSQTYVVTASTGTVASGTISYLPTAKVAWANDAAITFKGTASTSYAQNIAFHRDAIAFATRPLADTTRGLGNEIMSMVDPVSGISLRLEVSREHRRTRWSFDILYGVKLVRPELACRVWGN